MTLHDARGHAYALVVAVTTSLFSTAAFAHAELVSANPGAGSASTSPKEIRITFSEPVISKFSGIELKDQSGKLIATGKSAIDPADKKVLVVQVKGQLAPGDYKVEWHAVADDTHKASGSYSFSVNH